ACEPATAGAASTGGQTGGATPGDGVRPAMIYNILRFMTLPEARARLRLCVRKGDALAPGLQALGGEPLGAGQLEVDVMPSFADGSRGCDVIYAGNAPAGSLVPGHGQILIGEGQRFAEDGGTVALLSFGGQVRFAINARVANRSGIRVSSQLLRLAAKVVN
ncbi:MAG TPA: YfiR family protein, partial [Novosphingobium sp.]|nr:YfiR family protein [Novosphingobium sp.]